MNVLRCQAGSETTSSLSGTAKSPSMINFLLSLSLLFPCQNSRSVCSFSLIDGGAIFLLLLYKIRSQERASRVSNAKVEIVRTSYVKPNMTYPMCHTILLVPKTWTLEPEKRCIKFVNETFAWRCSMTTDKIFMFSFHSIPGKNRGQNSTRINCVPVSHWSRKQRTPGCEISFPGRVLPRGRSRNLGPILLLRTVYIIL